LLISLAATSGIRSAAGTVVIGLRLPQERLGEMLGVSRQTATGLVRELVDDGLVHWRYGRVTLLDLPRLQAIAAEGGEGVR
jgi:DNA-binding FadR family transcriptional regulator